jgi:hypothetical protein
MKLSTWVGGLLCCVPIVASAQRVSGTVRVAGTPAFLSGTVVAVNDSAGRPLVRTLTDESGRYSIQLPPGAVQVRAVRIGFRPGVATIVRGQTGDLTIDLTMERAPVVLQAMRVAADASCRSSEDGRMVLQLWEHARSALLAAIVAREAKPARVRVLGYERSMEPARRLITEQRVRFNVGLSTRPVAARPPQELAATGYRTGAGPNTEYFAPDADVLFDESFAEHHCFGVTTRQERGSQIGLTFSPKSRRRDFIDVTGVLWINPAAPELVQLDFRYTNLDPEMEAAGSGGTVHFRTMRNGVVFVDSWSIVLPRMRETTRRDATGRTITSHAVVDISESGGYVMAAEWPDGAKWIDPTGGIRGQVLQAGTKEPAPGAAVTLTGVVTVESDSTGAYAFVPTPPGRYEISATDSAFSKFMRTRRQSREVTLAWGDTLTANFEVQSRGSALSQLCRSQVNPTHSYVLFGRITDGSETTPDWLKMEVSWYDAPGAALDLQTLRQATQESDVTSSGDFFVCGIPRKSSHVTFRAKGPRLVVGDTSIPSAANVLPPVGDTRDFSWALPAGTFAAASRGDGSMLSGRVTRNGNPVPEAQVWLVPADTAVTTDSSGRFRIAGLRAGQQIVQIRRLGLAVKRDTVTLKARDETRRDFSMDGIPELDTVRTQGAARKYDSPRLQEFERRRLSGHGGNFVSEDQLRELESISLPSILRTNIVGAQIETRGGKQLLASRLPPSIGVPANANRLCYASVFIDGISMYSGEVNVPPPDLASLIPPIGLSGIEYYRGGASLPLQYKNTKNDCGTLLLWTRGK